MRPRNKFGTASQKDITESRNEPLLIHFAYWVQIFIIFDICLKRKKRLLPYR